MADQTAVGFAAIMDVDFDDWTRDQVERSYDAARRRGGEYWEGATSAYEIILRRRWGRHAVARAKLGTNFTDHRVLFDIRQALIDGRAIEESIDVLTDIIEGKRKA